MRRDPQRVPGRSFTSRRIQIRTRPGRPALEYVVLPAQGIHERVVEVPDDLRPRSILGSRERERSEKRQNEDDSHRAVLTHKARPGRRSLPVVVLMFARSQRPAALRINLRNCHGEWVDRFFLFSARRRGYFPSGLASCEFDKRREGSLRPAGVNRFGRDLNTLAKSFRLPRRDQRRGSIRQYRVAARSAFAFQHAL